MSIHGTAMVEDDAIRFALSRTKTTADHLPEQAHLFGGAGEDDAARLGHVPAFGEHHAVRDDLNLATFEPGEDLVALVFRRGAVEMLAADVELEKSILDRNAVGHVAGEDHGLAALTVLEPIGNDVADQLVGVHAG